MATAEQLPGELDIEVVQGDDLNIQATVDATQTGYTYVATVHELHGSTYSATVAASVQTATTVIEISFPASMTSSLAVTGDDGAHNWKLVYTDTASLTRTFLKGAFTVLTKI
jgi:hypothetical protein